jgi:hypothetical protein
MRNMMMSTVLPAEVDSLSDVKLHCSASSAHRDSMFEAIKCSSICAGELRGVIPMSDFNKVAVFCVC